MMFRMQETAHIPCVSSESRLSDSLFHPSSVLAFAMALQDWGYHTATACFRFSFAFRTATNRVTSMLMLRTIKTDASGPQTVDQKHGTYTTCCTIVLVAKSATEYVFLTSFSLPAYVEPCARPLTASADRAPDATPHNIIRAPVHQSPYLERVFWVWVCLLLLCVYSGVERGDPAARKRATRV